MQVHKGPASQSYSVDNTYVAYFSIAVKPHDDGANVVYSTIFRNTHEYFEM